MKERKINAVTKPRKPVNKKKAPRPAFETLHEDVVTDTMDAALTSAEEHLRKLLPTFQPYAVAVAFEGHVGRHLNVELSNIADHGHANDDPADVPPASKLAAPTDLNHMLDADGEKCLYCEQSSSFAHPDEPCPARTQAIHTPGPWHVSPDQAAQGEGICVQTDDGFVIARVPVGKPCDEANATLIAQAPAMQDKLAQITDIIVNHYGEEDERFSKSSLKQILDSIVEVMDAKQVPPTPTPTSKLVEFVELVARMKTLQEFGNDPPEQDDWIETLNDLIENARKILPGVGPDLDSYESENS
jgi:hypothetical protein